ncbi:hypothetical protein NKH77_19610 [Streptomyces sp. M19]
MDDKQYAIPMGRGIESMAYDAELWREAGAPAPTIGWTWDDWAEAMRVIAKSGVGRSGGTDPGQSEDTFEIWLRGQGKSSTPKTASASPPTT